MSHQEVEVVIALLTGSVFKYAMSWWARKHAWKNMEEVGVVSALHIYPVKSCKGIQVNEASSTQLGLKHEETRDRIFMVTNTEYTFVNIRQEPSMALIVTSIHGKYIHLDAPNMETLVIPQSIMCHNKSVVSCRVYGDKVNGVHCSEEATSWFCRYLQRDGLYLMYMNNQTQHDSRSFVDDCPYMLLSTSSLVDLNKRLDVSNQVTIPRFRPNIVVTGCSPYDEDNWDEVVIGSGASHFQKHDTCLRCTLITVDPETGVKDKDVEPLKTLKLYRMADGKDSPSFGLYLKSLMTSTGGKICVGDKVYVRRSIQ